MNLNEFLQKVFTVFPPKSSENILELMDIYRNALVSNKNYDYYNAFSKVLTTYKYRELPTCQFLLDTLQGFVIKNNEAIEYRDVIAYNKNVKYIFTYNPKEQSYEEVKRDLVNQGLRVFDSEQEEYV